MPSLSHHSSLPSVGGAAASPWWRRGLRGLAAWIRGRDELARQHRALTRLDDRLLRDIGLTREQRDRCFTHGAPRGRPER